MPFSYLTKKLLTTDKKVEKFVRLELSIQACLDVMQNKGRSTITGSSLKESHDKITL